MHGWGWKKDKLECKHLVKYDGKKIEISGVSFAGFEFGGVSIQQNLLQAVSHALMLIDASQFHLCEAVKGAPDEITKKKYYEMMMNDKMRAQDIIMGLAALTLNPTNKQVVDALSKMLLQNHKRALEIEKEKILVSKEREQVNPSNSLEIGRNKFEAKMGQIEKVLPSKKNFQDANTQLMKELAPEIDKSSPWELQVIELAKGKKVGTGWLLPKDDVDEADKERLQFVSTRISNSLLQKENDSDRQSGVPESINLRQYFLDVRDQGTLNSSSAHAITSLLEYFWNKNHGRTTPLSPLYLYKVTRSLMDGQGNIATWFETTFKALGNFGITYEHYWPYTDNQSEFDKEIPNSVRSQVVDSKTTRRMYSFTLDDEDPVMTLKNVKKFLSVEWPCVFGFLGFESYKVFEDNGKIPYPCRNERPQFGQAIIAAG